MSDKKIEDDADIKPDDANAGGEPGGDGSSNKTSFNQADIDAIVAERLAREKAKYADYEDLRKKAKKLDEIEEANKTELEKAQEAAKLAQEERDAMLQQANDIKIKAKFETIASKLGVKHPEDAFALADRSGVSISEDGSVVGVDDAVKKLVEAGRLPLTGTKVPELNAGAGDHDGELNQKSATEEQKKIAAKMGIKLEDYMKFVKEKKAA